MKEGDTIYLGLPFYRFTLPEISASCGNAKFDISFRNAGKVNCSLMLNITSGIINSSSYCSLKVELLINPSVESRIYVSQRFSVDNNNILHSTLESTVPMPLMIVTHGIVISSSLILMPNAPGATRTSAKYTFSYNKDLYRRQNNIVFTVLARRWQYNF